MRNHILIFAIVLISFVSCNSNHSKQEIRFPNNNWIKFNELEFNLAVEAGKSYDFSANLITDTLFNRRKIDIGFYAYLPSGEERLSDLTFRLLDYEYQSLGEKTPNGIINEFILKENLHSSESGNLKVKIVLHSQYYDNPGIIGLDFIVNEN